MSRRFVWICCLLSLAAATSAAQAQDRLRAAPRMSRPPQGVPGIQPSLRSVAVCRPGEQMCAIGGAITWCCRADQQCSYSYPGACR